MVHSGGTAVAGCDVLGDGTGCPHASLETSYIEIRVPNQSPLGRRDTVPLRLKKSSKTLLNSRGKCTAGNTVDPHLSLLSFFSLLVEGTSWWVRTRMDGVLTKGLELHRPCPWVCSWAVPKLGLELPTLCPTTIQTV